MGKSLATDTLNFKGEPRKRAPGAGRKPGVTNAMVAARRVVERTVKVSEQENAHLNDSLRELNLLKGEIKGVVETQIDLWDKRAIEWLDLEPESQRIIRARYSHLTSDPRNRRPVVAVKTRYIVQPYIVPNTESGKPSMRVTVIPAGKQTWRPGQTRTRVLRKTESGNYTF